MKGKYNNPISGNPDGVDDDTVTRGTTGQSLRDSSMDYDPSTGLSNGDNDSDDNVNLGNVPGYISDMEGDD